jgi:hypothetical protein
MVRPFLLLTLSQTSANGGFMRQWEAIGISRSTWYRRGKPTTKPYRVTQEQTAKLMNISVRSLQRAKRIAREAPELESLIMAGHMKLKFAEQLAKDPELKARFFKILDQGRE